MPTDWYITWFTAASPVYLVYKSEYNSCHATLTEVSWPGSCWVIDILTLKLRSHSIITSAHPVQHKNNNWSWLRSVVNRVLSLSFPSPWFLSVLTSLTFDLRVLSLLCKGRGTDRQTDRQTERDRRRQGDRDRERQRHRTISHVTVDSPVGDTKPNIITVSYINKPEAGKPRTMSKGCGWEEDLSHTFFAMTIDMHVQHIVELVGGHLRKPLPSLLAHL